MSQKAVPLEAIRPTAERVVRLAAAVYGGYGADVVWREPDKLSRTKPFDGDRNDRFPSLHVMATGEPLWISDFHTDPAAIDNGLVAASPRVKAFLGAPILSGETVLGALIAISMEVREYDPAMVGHFQALASLLGEAFTRARLACDLEAAVKRMSEALDETARSERRLKLATRLAGVRVWELDHVRREAFRDGAAEAGHRDYDITANTLWDAVHPEDRPAAQAEWARHLDGGPPMLTIYRRELNGEYRWVESAAEAVRDDHGGLAGIVGAVRDIQREKVNEQELIDARIAAETADAAKSNFLATVSHEIRTPLNGILGMAQAMEMDDLPERQRERLGIVRQSSESLLAIVDDVLDLSKINAGKLQLEALEFDLAALLDGVRDTFSSVASAKGLQLQTHLDEGASGIYLGDPGRVRQVLSNLVSNALKFTSEGAVRVSAEKAADGLLLRVTDTGIGIPDDRQAALFEPFVQVDTSTTRRFGGTGLGLSICRELTELMGGRIALHSTLGAGSAFEVTLPLDWVRTSTPPSATANDVAPQGPSLAEVRVLAAEDNPVNQLVLKTLLGHFGIEPTIVGDGEAAFEAWRAESWDLILMDAQMPRLDGVAATRRIRAAEAETGRPRTPIIALTANALSHQADEYSACGMDDLVAKPIQLPRLVEVMNRVLASSELVEPAAAPTAQRP